MMSPIYQYFHYVQFNLCEKLMEKFSVLPYMSLVKHLTLHFYAMPWHFIYFIKLCISFIHLHSIFCIYPLELTETVPITLHCSHKTKMPVASKQAIKCLPEEVTEHIYHSLTLDDLLLKGEFNSNAWKCFWDPSIRLNDSLSLKKY